MTELSDRIQQARRRRDGSIDFDYYRTRSTAMRAAAKRDTHLLKTLLRSLAIGTLTVVGVAFVMSAPAPVVDVSCKHCSARMVPVDEPSAAAVIASSPRASRAE
jgi:hypothetical protein